MHVVKNLADLWSMPLAVACLLAAAAGLFRMRGRTRVSVGLWIVAAAIAYGSSTNAVGDALLRPLEQCYAPLSPDSVQGADYIVVLGTGYKPRDGIPVTAAIDEDGLARIVEGIRLSRSSRSVRLVVSGGAAPGEMPSAIGYARLALDLGVEKNSLIVLDTPRDTAEEARAAARLIGRRPFILVTSAYHMPRAMHWMADAGLRPIPAPTGQYVGISNPRDWRYVFPTGTGLRKTERALHEYLGFIAIAAGIS
jgi:uncharacterized SAM-binding protein YcdF (DUF218 family)